MVYQSLGRLQGKGEKHMNFLNNVVDRLLKRGLNRSIEGLGILTLVFSDVLPNVVLNEASLILGSIWAIFKFYETGDNK